jgi:hypothetical protein
VIRILRTPKCTPFWTLNELWRTLKNSDGICQDSGVIRGTFSLCKCGADFIRNLFIWCNCRMEGQTRKQSKSSNWLFILTLGQVIRWRVCNSSKIVLTANSKQTSLTTRGDDCRIELEHQEIDRTFASTRLQPVLPLSLYLRPTLPCSGSHLGFCRGTHSPPLPRRGYLFRPFDFRPSRPLHRSDSDPCGTGHFPSRGALSCQGCIIADSVKVS